jgi:RNA polymerase sigma-70 factor (ECF subfamily)
MTDEEFRPIYERYRDPLYRFAWRLTGSPAASEDIVHDCFVGLYRGGFDSSRASMQTYLFAAARNLTRKYHRANGRDYDLMPGSQSDPLDSLVAAETAGQVRRAVEALPMMQREVLVLFEYEELSLEEVAAVVEAEVGAVKSRLYRARESLRKSLFAMKGVAR